MRDYRKPSEIPAEPFKLPTPCAHANCTQPAITRDALGASICRDHWMHAHALETRAELVKRGIEPGKEGARYALSKMAYDLANGMKKPGSKDWDYRIKERMEAGENVPTCCMDMANEVVSLSRAKEAA